MTYNVHSCVGTDGKTDPIRIAHVIASENADVVSLQELDRGLRRTGLSDQARVIAGHLAMHYRFYPSMKIEEGLYGNAVLSRFPIRTVKAAELPSLPSRNDIERRGALWVEISAGEKRVQVINTHLGLNRQERLAQAESLLSAEWLKDPACLDPVILCGDLNTTALSRIYRWLSAPLRDSSRLAGKGSRATYPARFPLLRLDYIFLSPEIMVREVRIPSDPLSRRASDHLPVAATLDIP
jgi:endonuclease/exonuclease/phosphatase family metal-dependent hydrolase